jgi:hypothetical protein
LHRKIFRLLAKQYDERNQKANKAKLQTYLSAMREHCNSLGVAAQNGYFEFDSQAFSELKKFIEQLK